MNKYIEKTKVFSAKDLAKSKVAKHLSDEFTNRDLFGVVRAHCTRCPCKQYLKETKDYTVSPGDTSGRGHPDNDLTIINCNTCGCPSDAHAIAQAENEKEHGNDAFEFQQYDLALQRYTAAIEHAPHDPKIWSNRSAVYLSMGQYAQALHDAERAIQLDPQWVKARARKAQAHLQLNQLEEAIKAYKLCCKMEPTKLDYQTSLKDAQARLAYARDPKKRADTAYQQKNFASAITLYTTAIENNAKDGKLYSNRSACYAKLHQYNDALRDANQAAKLLPKWDKAWSRKGLALFYLERYEEAMAAYDAAIRLAPGNESLVTARAESKAALMERNLRDLQSSMHGARAAGAPAAAAPTPPSQPSPAQPPESSWSPPTPAPAAPPSLCDTLSARSFSGSEEKGGTGGGGGGGESVSGASHAGSGSAFPAGSQMLASVRLQVATLESVRAGLLSELHDLQRHINALGAKRGAGLTHRSPYGHALNDDGLMMPAPLEYDKATVMWVRLVRDVAEGPVDIFLCTTVDITVQELKVKVQLAADMAIPAEAQVLLYRSVPMLDDNTHVTDSGYDFSPQAFITCTLKQPEWGESEAADAVDLDPTSLAAAAAAAAATSSPQPRGTHPSPRPAPAAMPAASELASDNESEVSIDMDDDDLLAPNPATKLTAANLFSSLGSYQPEVAAGPSAAAAAAPPEFGQTTMGILDSDGEGEEEDAGDDDGLFRSTLLQALADDADGKPAPASDSPADPDTKSESSSPTGGGSPPTFMAATGTAGVAPAGAEKTSKANAAYGERVPAEIAAAPAPAPAAARPARKPPAQPTPTGKREVLTSANLFSTLGKVQPPPPAQANSTAPNAAAQPPGASSVAQASTGFITESDEDEAAMMASDGESDDADADLKHMDRRRPSAPASSAAPRGGSSVGVKVSLANLQSAAATEPAAKARAPAPATAPGSKVSLADLSTIPAPPRANGVPEGERPVKPAVPAVATSVATSVPRTDQAAKPEGVKVSIANMSIAGGAIPVRDDAKAGTPSKPVFGSRPAAAFGSVAAVEAPAAVEEEEAAAAAVVEQAEGAAAEGTTPVSPVTNDLLAQLNAERLGRVAAAKLTQGPPQTLERGGGRLGSAAPAAAPAAPAAAPATHAVAPAAARPSARTAPPARASARAAPAQAVQANDLLSMLKGGVTSSAAGAAKAVEAEGEGAEEERLEQKYEDMKSFFEQYMEDFNEDDDEENDGEDREDQDDEEGDLDAWAEAWEAEQWAARQAREAVGSRTPGGVSREKGSPKVTPSRSLNAMSLDSLTAMLKKDDVKRQRDANDVARAGCGRCGDQCTAYRSWKSGEPGPTEPKDGLTLQQMSEQALMNLRCGRCWCRCTRHETVEQAKARARKEEAARRKAMSEAEREEEARLARKLKAKQREAAAEAEGEHLQSTNFDQMQGAERHRCTTCAECPGFELRFRSADALDVEVMFYCSNCGCAAQSHEITSDWKKEQEGKAQQERKKQQQHDHSYKQKHQDRSHGQRGHAAGGKRESASAASGSIKANKKERAAYELLELDPTATDKQIRTAYRKLALKWHPDKNDPSRREEVQAKFIAITAAFQLISGEGKK